MKSVVLITTFLIFTTSLFSVIRKIGEVQTPGNAKSISVSGTLAFVAADTSGLHVIDIKDLHNPKLISSYVTHGYVNSVTSSGNKVYIADSELGMAVLDVSNPLKPVLIGSVKTPDFPTAITISGNQAYLAVRYAGMQIVDITDPAKPQLLGSCVTPNGLKPEDFDDEEGYDPDDPSQLLGNAQAIAVHDNFAYVGANNSGFHIIDISDLSHPKLISSDLSLKNVGSIALSGAIAYVVDYDQGLKLYDVSLPAKPLLLGSYKSSYSMLSHYVIGNMVYLCNGDNLQVIDVSNPKQPLLKAFYSTLYPGLKFTIVKDIAFFACGEEGLKIFDMSDVANPPYLSAISTKDFTYSVNLIGNTAYVVDSGKLQIMDVADPKQPQVVGSLQFPLNSRGESIHANYVTIHGKTAYFTTMNDGVKIVDISIPQKPQFLGGFDLPSKNDNNVSSISVEGSVAYVTNFGSGYLYTFDVTTPVKAKVLGSCLLPGYINSATIQDNLAYVAGKNGLQIVDVSQPKNLKLVGSYPISGEAHNVTIKDNYAYVLEWRSSLVILDVSKPTAPAIVTTINPRKGSSITAFAIEGNQVIIYDANWNEFSIYDISNPKLPVYIGTIPWNLRTIGFTMSLGKIYTADAEDGFHILDYQVFTSGKE